MSLTRTSRQALRTFRIRSTPITSQLPFKAITPYAPAFTALSQSQSRTATSATSTGPMSPQESLQILKAQRLNRPTSPHLTIYQPQIPWVLSGLNRITGCIGSGAIYIFGAAYLVSPLTGWHLDSASMAAAFAAWPVVVKMLVKLGVAWPVVFHSVNGVRHLVWDLGRNFSNKNVIRSGWAVVGLSTVLSLGLVAFV